MLQNYTSQGISTSSYGRPIRILLMKSLWLGWQMLGMDQAIMAKTNDDLKEPFMEELALLNAICANLKISFSLKESSSSVINQNIVVNDG